MEIIDEEQASNVKFGTNGEVESSSRFLVAQTTILQKVLDIVVNLPESKWHVVGSLIACALDTCDTITKLAELRKMRDCFVLTRTAFETLINTCFILAKGNEAVARAQQHSLQKSYRDLDRESSINGANIHLTCNARVNMTPELQAALAEFTSKKGREITSWTPETTAEQIAVISQRVDSTLAMMLQVALFAIYRHSSEIAHGTYFGALYAMGLTRPEKLPFSPETIAQQHREMISLMLQMLTHTITVSIELLAEELPITKLVIESRTLWEEFCEA